jgi:hypothetical protein
MKLTVIERREVNVKYLSLTVAVRYDDEDMPFDAPMRRGDLWDAVINLDTHTVEDWPQGQTLAFDMKVCDQGTYVLLDADLKELARLENEYVPCDLFRGSGGDYLELDIDETGKITNWLENANLSDFEDQQQ